MGFLGLLDSDDLQRQKLLNDAQADAVPMMPDMQGPRGMMANDKPKPVQLPATTPEWRPPMAPDTPEGWRPPMALPEKPRFATPPTASSVMGMSPAPAPMDTGREGVPIPALPGDAGGPRGYTPEGAQRYDQMSQFIKKVPGYGSDDPIEKARFENQIAGLKRDDQGLVTDKYKNSFGQVLRNALMGFVQAAAANPQNALGAGLGGLATGAIGSAVSPGGAREYAFDTQIAPRMRQQEARAIEREQREYGKKKQGVELETDQAKLGQIKAQTDATRAGMKDAELTREKQKAEIALLEARAQALKQGKPVVRDVLGDDGEIHSVEVYPDGTRRDLGISGRAAMQTENINSRERIAGQREKGANERFRLGEKGKNQRLGVTEAGKNQRLQTTEAGRNSRLPGATGSKLGGGPKGMGAGPAKSVSANIVRQYAAQANNGQGISYAEAVQRFKAKGINVVE